ncbi:MAG: spermine synthase, partial [Solirubrobacterales bacterium]|nr:spermine synthase [Solirubrobacterales bacterium]
YLLTREFFSQVRSHLNPGGQVIVNVGHVPGSDSLEKVVSATMHTAFRVVARDRFDETNSLVIGSEAPLSRARIYRAAPPELRPLAFSAGLRLAPALAGGSVYTDDRAPVEWLTDLSIVRYAAGSK